MSYKICFIGAGNLATHLSKALQNKGHTIQQIYSKTNKSAKSLANILACKYTTSTKEISTDADLYFIALKDSAVQSVLSEIDFRNKLVVHCSGSLQLSVLEEYSANIGVLYPLQTFTKTRTIDFNNIPIFIEAKSKKNENILLEIGRTISREVSILNSEKRKSLHISAVFACNFVNHMYAIAAGFLDAKNISFDVLKPLIQETAQKVQEIKPKDAQTGPAVRFDENIINDHLSLLKDFPEYKELYNSISKSIFKFHQEKNI
jgi:predicted short-subunit dehydrogenase-like oxidoreductase (DUF2520 family)